MAIGGSAIRGSRIGAGPLGEAERGESAARFNISYWCSNGHESSPSFSVDAVDEIPDTWDCARCGLTAGTDKENPPSPVTSTPYKSHLDYVKERRSEAESVDILNEALSKLRQKRGTA